MTKHRKNNKKGVLQLKGLVWISRGENNFLGHGRVYLLEMIKEHGSITLAAKSMEMSYKHAWDLVDSMNNQAGEPLVEKVTGGKGGGGTKLTEAGEKAIKLYWELQNDLNEFLRKEEQKLKIL
ncbi:MAG: LysR family transcriptional regulator [Nitrospirae bacterium]|nr:LysR family transcriptional regulator [Nitrospirota bacterium]